MTYTFNEKGHRHLWDGKQMTGVTTILNIISKPNLIQWATNMACDYIKEKFKSIDFPVAVDTEILQWIEEARKAHTKKKEAAGDIGKLVHFAVEEWIKNKTEPTLDEQGMKMFENFRKWATDNKVEFVESEKHLYSESLFVGGIVDIVVEIEGEFWIVDIKTSSGIYAEAFWQMGGYEILMKEMGIYQNIKGYIVLNLKKDGSFEDKKSISNSDNQKAFMACLDIYRLKQKIESQIL